MEAYNNCYITYPINSISYLTGIPIQKNKRNGRKQEQHIKIMNAIRDIEYRKGEWRNKKGRPNKEKIVRKYLKENLEARNINVIKETGLSKPTVYKYYDKVKLELQTRNLEIKKLKEELEIWKIKLSKILLKNQDNEEVRNDRKYIRPKIWKLGIELQK